jgi:hypothetical protein
VAFSPSLEKQKRKMNLQTAVVLKILISKVIQTTIVWGGKTNVEVGNIFHI